MDSRQEAVDLSVLIPIWANAWARELGVNRLEWAEYVVANLNVRLKWHLNSHAKDAESGLKLRISAIEPVPAVLETAAIEGEQPKTTATTSPAPVTQDCVSSETITKQAKRLQQVHFAGTPCKVELLGSIVVCFGQKVTTKLDNNPKPHSKWPVSIKTMIAEMHRFALIEDEKIISNQDRITLQTALAQFTTAEVISFVLPESVPALTLATEEGSKASASSVQVAATSAKSQISMLERFGFKGSNGKGVPAPEKPVAVTLIPQVDASVSSSTTNTI